VRERNDLMESKEAELGVARLKVNELVGPGGMCLFFCPHSLCLIPHILPIMLGVCPILPNYAD